MGNRACTTTPMGLVVYGIPTQNLVDTFEMVTAYQGRVRQRIDPKHRLPYVIRVCMKFSTRVWIGKAVL